MQLSAKLKTLRIIKGQTLQEIADSSGSSKSYIYGLESGTSTNPSIKLLKNLAFHFKVNIADLVNEVTET
jgi:transcriptional regulator with XRE-family HTH domain